MTLIIKYWIALVKDATKARNPVVYDTTSGEICSSKNIGPKIKPLNVNK